MLDDDLQTPEKHRKKIDEKEKKKARKDIEGEKSITYTYKDKKSSDKE